MKKILTVFLVAFIVLGTGQAFASGQNENTVNQEERISREDREDHDGLTDNLYRLSKIESLGILGQANEEIGDVEEVVLNLNGGVTHLIVDLNDAKDIEDGKYLVPINSIRIHNTENMTLDLQRAQEFKSYNADSDEQRAEQLPVDAIRFSDFRGYKVIGPRGDNIASMDDGVVDLGTGQVVYISITSGGFLGFGRENYAVSFDKVQVVVAEEQIRLNITESDLERMEGFDNNNWPAQGQMTATGDLEREGLTGGLYRMSTIEGFGIMNKNDEQIGNAVEPVLTMEGQMTHLIVDLSNVEGFEHGRYLVPINAISVYDTENFVLDVAQAEGFTRFNDGRAAWANNTQTTSGEGTVTNQVPVNPEVVNNQNSVDTVDPAMTNTQHLLDPAMANDQLPEGKIRSSDFHWYDVVGSRDEVIARVEDMVVDMDTGEIVYVAIGSGGFLGIGREYYAISFDRVLFEVADERIRIDMTEEDLEQLKGFNHDQWPNEGRGRRVSKM